MKAVWKALLFFGSNIKAKLVSTIGQCSVSFLHKQTGGYAGILTHGSSKSNLGLGRRKHPFSVSLSPQMGTKFACRFFEQGEDLSHGMELILGSIHCDHGNVGPPTDLFASSKSEKLFLDSQGSMQSGSGCICLPMFGGFPVRLPSIQAHSKVHTENQILKSENNSNSSGLAKKIMVCHSTETVYSNTLEFQRGPIC